MRACAAKYRDWLRVVARNRIAPTLARWEDQRQPSRRKLDADPVALRELAAKEKSPRIRERMLVLACVADGMSPFDAVSTGLDDGAIIKRIKRFKEEGIAAFQDRKKNGRPCRLNAAQLQELRLAGSERLEMSYGQPVI